VVWAVLFSALFLTACTTQKSDNTIIQAPELPTMKTIAFQTEDEVTIVGKYWKGGRTAVLLVHMMPATKESWDEFAAALAAEGYTVLAIDLRGHGESTEQNGNTLNYKTFSDQQHQDSIHDVEAAVRYLSEQGAATVYIGGASIGANLALQYQAEHPEIKKTILMSPGTNYRGVLTEPAAEKLRQDQEAYLLAGSLDGRSAGNAADMAKQIQSKIVGQTELKIYESSAHGTDLFDEDDMLAETLIAWLQG